MKKYFTIFILLIFISLISLSTPLLTQAQTTKTPLLTGQAASELTAQDVQFLRTTGLSPNSPVIIVSMVIRIVLGLLGVIFVIFIIYAGFNWLTSAGSEEKIEKAKKTIISSIIGLAIVLSAYIITVFVISRIIDSVTDDYSGSRNSNSSIKPFDWNILD